MPNVKLLHTADLHLNADRPETVEALEVVLAEADRHEVDIVTIAGDLFDTQAAADALRPQLRPLFSDNPFEIVAIPSMAGSGFDTPTDSEGGKRRRVP